jgi:putative ABC transport system permease protein
VSYLPFSGGLDSSPFDIPTRPAQPNGPPYHANTEVIAGDYFRAMGIPLLRGRGFTASDAAGPPVVVIDEYLAKTYFGGEDPVGRQIRHNELATIVGVVGNVTPIELGAPPHATVYHPYAQNPWLNFTTITIRSALPDQAVTALTRGIVRELDPTLPLYDVLPMGERIAGSVAPRRLAMLVLGGFAGLSLLLALLGIYGVISYSTTQRTQEIGIRVALGARPGVVALMVLRRGLALAVVGLTAGLVLFLAAGRVVESLLFGVSPRDPLTIVAGVLVLAAVTLVASYLPARRAARVDPLVALRAE